jgi:hypothetical protein
MVGRVTRIPFVNRGRGREAPLVVHTRQVAHSSKYLGLCPVHRSLIAMSGSSFVPWASACGRGLSGQGAVLQVLLTGINRFGLFGVSFLVSWICISVPFCAPTCMFSTKGKLHTKKNRGHDRPLRVDSKYLMAREGFEPPIALRLCLISRLAYHILLSII